MREAVYSASRRKPHAQRGEGESNPAGESPVRCAEGVACHGGEEIGVGGAACFAIGCVAAGCCAAEGLLGEINSFSFFGFAVHPPWRICVEMRVDFGDQTV